MKHHLVLSASAAVMYLGLAISQSACAKDVQTKWALGPFERPANAQPVIRPDSNTQFDCPFRKEPVGWQSRHTFNPAATLIGDRICVLYRAEDERGNGTIGSYTSRLGMAFSDDGFSLACEPKPVFFPKDDAQKEFEWSGGCEDPRLAVGSDGTFVITYTQYAGRNPAPGNPGWRIGLATSRDLRSWTKFGSPFAGTPFEKTRIKSAGILQKPVKGRLVAAKLDNKYWMYFGERSVNIASSPDLIHWTPATDGQGKLLDIMKTRRGFFDSNLTEVGPSPILTNDGIVLIYNGKNNDPQGGGDPSLAKGVYTCGQALFDKNDPTHLVGRLDRPFFKPELAWEKTGQYVDGTTFAEGLVLFKDRWFLYYGCADTYVGVASAPGPGLAAMSNNKSGGR